MTSAPAPARAPLPARVRVAVVGSGFSGLGAAVRLRQAGVDDLVVLERADSVGGTGRDNTYPGCACDVPSHLHSSSFAPNPDRSRTCSHQVQRLMARFDAASYSPRSTSAARDGSEVRQGQVPERHLAVVPDRCLRKKHRIPVNSSSPEMGLPSAAYPASFSPRRRPEKSSRRRQSSGSSSSTEARARPFDPETP